MMDASTKIEIPVKLSEWKRLGYVDSPNFRSNNLTREISPVFRYMDEQGKKRWTQLSTKEYQVIEPVCRLASAMIESPASLAFLHALLYSPRTEITSPSPLADYPCYQFHRSEPSSIPDSEDPRLALKRLAPNMSWILADDAEFSNANAKTSVNWVTCKIVDNDRIGFRSTIELQKKLVRDLSTLTQQYGNTSLILSQQFLIATILCHEVAHALNIAVDPALMFAFRSELAINNSPPQTVKHCEPFFEDQSHTELGHCWENEVLGGNVVPDPALDHPIVICKWPNPVIRQIEGGLAPPQRRGHKDTVTFYIVPAHFIHSIQQQQFWDCLDPADVISLRVQRMTGSRAPRPPGYVKDEYWEAEGSSEGDWPADEHNCVYRYEEPDVVARKYSSANHAATTKWILDLPEPAV